MHDRFLVLAADAALNGGKGGDAERLRQQLLQQNPHHLLKPFASFAEAVRSDDVRNYVRALRRSHPPEAAEQLLRTLQSGEGAPPAAASPAREGPADLGTLDPAEPLKVYRMKDDSGQRPTPGPAQVPPTLSVPRPEIPAGQAAPVAGPKPRAMPVPVGPAPAKAGRPLPSGRPAPPEPPREVYGLRPGPDDRRSRPAEEGEDDGRTAWATVWASNVLTALTLLAGVGLTAYTLARPFLPAEWFR
jgi:hypothetical protein